MVGTGRVPFNSGSGHVKPDFNYWASNAGRAPQALNSILIPKPPEQPDVREVFTRHAPKPANTPVVTPAVRTQQARNFRFDPTGLRGQS